MTRRMLITRPRAQSDRFADLIAPLGWVPVFAPLTEIVPMTDTAVPSHYQTLLFTSANGVRAFAYRVDPAGLRALCVGDRTADIARELGFDAASAGGTVDDLLGLALRDGEEPFLHVRGVHGRGDLVGHLSDAGRQASEAILYDQRPLPLSTARLDDLAGGAISAVSLLSPRASCLFVEQVVGKIRSDLPFFCLSQAIAELLHRTGFTQVFTAQKPDMASLIACIRDHPSGAS